MKQKIVVILFAISWATGSWTKERLPDCILNINGNFQKENTAFSGYEVASKGAWCWFADPRALHHKSKDGNIDKTYIGYIDVHGNIKATQIDWNTQKREEVLVRSWFQPDDHNNPTFLVLPDERIMIFYSRHTDEACFYYRVSRKPGDITTLGEEKIIKTKNNTTYPSPFILSDDSNHIYLCWRGIAWHPTIGRLLIPDANDNTNFDWGPYQMIQSTGSRPYAKYASNGKDKIYMTYTTGHPDNEQPNHVYFNYIDINTLELKDIKGKVLATIQDGPHHVNKRPEYAKAYPNAIVSATKYRNWVWEVATDHTGKPIIAMTQISEDKTKHDYYYVKWTGTAWQSTFLTHAGGHFHQTPDTERCYSAGMAIDKQQPEKVVCSVPVEGIYGKVYELIKYTVSNKISEERITQNSKKNNIRPYFIQSAGKEPFNLIWMNGDYYDWIVSSKRPLGYCTGIHAIIPLPHDSTKLTDGLIKKDKYSSSNVTSREKIPESSFIKDIQLLDKCTASAFTVSLRCHISSNKFHGMIIQTEGFTYALDGATRKPYVTVGGSIYKSTNVLGNSDGWRQAERSTNGKWIAPQNMPYVNLTITYQNGILRTYIDGLLDQNIPTEKIELGNVTIGEFKGILADYAIYNRCLSQDEIKELAINMKDIKKKKTN